MANQLLFQSHDVRGTVTESGRPAVSICAQCGAALTQKLRGRPRRYCSPACRKAAHRARAEAWKVQEEAHPQLAKMPTLADMYDAEHGDGFDVKAWFADCEARGVVPPKMDRHAEGNAEGDAEGKIVVAGADRQATPSPERSTVEDVLATVWAAVAVVVEFRRHGLAAPGLLAVKCAAVASALDAALAEAFPKKS
jgi:hypothetical protein